MVERPVIVSSSKLGGVQFQPDVFRPAEREIRMVIGVVADLVPLGDDSPNEIRDNFSAFTPTRKNAAFTLCRFQDVENLRRPFRIGPVIER